MNGFTGREQFSELLKNAIPMAEFLWRTELNAAPVDTPERRADLERRLMAAVDTIRDSTVRYQYRLFMRDKLKQLSAHQQKQDDPIDRILALLLKHPELLEQERETLDALAADNPPFAERLKIMRQRRS